MTRMRIHTKAGDKPFRTFIFPDGQRHLELLPAESDFREATVEAAIQSADDLFDVLLAKSALDAKGYVTNLDIRYLLGARMDRRIDARTPATLEVVTRTIMAAGFRRIRILEPHSEVSTRLLDAEAVYPAMQMAQAWASLPMDTVAVSPDAGASNRVGSRMVSQAHSIAYGEKKRDSATGKLSGFGLTAGAEFVAGHECLILDDICDGGGTFVGLAKVLREHGATKVHLFVTHGLFTKGWPLEGIDTVWTTDSVFPEGPEREAWSGRVVLPYTFPERWSGR